MGKKTEPDRTTRLLFSVTLLGGTWYVFRGVINLWIKTFTEIVYTKSIINFEHIISMWLLVMMVVITGTVIRYIYFEFKTYQHIPNNEDRINSLSNADEAFKDIFKMLKPLTIISIIVLILLFLFNFFIQVKLENFLLLIGVGSILGILYMVILNEKLKNKIKKITSKSKYKLSTSSTISKQLGLIIYLIILVLIVSFSLIVISIEGNQEVNMKIGDTKKVPMEILLSNYEKPTIEINIFREKKPASNVNIELEADDLQESFIEVYESRSQRENFLIKSIEEKNSKSTISKNKFYYKYHLNLEEHLLEGKNTIEVYIQNTGNSSKKTVHLVTSIYKEGNSINISQDIFTVKP